MQCSGSCCTFFSRTKQCRIQTLRWGGEGGGGWGRGGCRSSTPLDKGGGDGLQKNFGLKNLGEGGPAPGSATAKKDFVRTSP